MTARDERTLETYWLQRPHRRTAPRHEPVECELEPCENCLGDGKGEERTPTDRGDEIRVVSCGRCCGTGTTYVCPTCHRRVDKDGFEDADYLACFGDGVTILNEDLRH